MKYLNVLILLSFISVCQAQIDSKPFYYYFDEKVPIYIDFSHVHIPETLTPRFGFR